MTNSPRRNVPDMPSDLPKGKVTKSGKTKEEALKTVQGNMDDPSFKTYDPGKETSPAANDRNETSFLAAHPDRAQAFIDSTREYGGASMNLKDMSMPSPGDKVYITGKEPSKKTGESVDTEYINPGKSEITPRQFAFHFNRLKNETNDKKAMIGSWFHTKNKKTKAKGTQIDLSTGYAKKKVAEDKMVARGEDSLWNMESMRHVNNQAVRNRRGMGPRPAEETKKYD